MERAFARLTPACVAVAPREARAIIAVNGNDPAPVTRPVSALVSRVCAAWDTAASPATLLSVVPAPVGSALSMFASAGTNSLDDR